jgi:hypothetical protein
MSEYCFGSITSGYPGAPVCIKEDRPFTAEHYRTMRAETKILWDFTGVNMAWKLLLKSHEEFARFMGSQEKPLKVSHQLYLISAEVAELQLECLRLLMNFLASASAFLSISQTELKRNFSPAVFNIWDEKRKELHLNGRSYRIGYELRNYAQHYGFPVSQFNADMSPTKFHKIDMQVNVDELLAKDFNWNNKVKSDLQGLPEGRLELETMVSEYFDSLKNIHQNSVTCYQGGFERCASYLNHLLSAYKLQKEHSPVIFISARAGRTRGETMEFVPLYLFKEIHSDLNSQFGLQCQSVDF